MYSEREQISCCLSMEEDGSGQGTAGKNYKLAEDDLGVVAIFLILIMVMASQVYAYVKVSNWTP